MGLPLAGGSLALDPTVTAAQLRAAVDALDFSRVRLRCAACNKALMAGSAFSCGRCHGASYCGLPCQRRHWIKHKDACGAAAKAAAGKAAFGKAT